MPAAGWSNASYRLAALAEASPGSAETGRPSASTAKDFEATIASAIILLRRVARSA